MLYPASYLKAKGLRKSCALVTDGCFSGVIALVEEGDTIETAFRSPKEHRPGALQKNQYCELAEPDNPDAEPPCQAPSPPSSYSERMSDAR
jgi:hypothetical protein